MFSLGVASVLLIIQKSHLGNIANVLGQPKGARGLIWTHDISIRGINKSNISRLRMAIQYPPPMVDNIIFFSARTIRPKEVQRPTQF
ncbi:hypothetical protein M433DRAFT_164956 [Acidomyces richmondensis BFW]|nr:MAG: hypothetical protein FE78DRAFT_104388 [Acidomyces sp. 'richmondensis']KYG46739.1 hypothetical protein M433DRAFT_164956 [Acidomyces richmondensis BFW]